MRGLKWWAWFLGQLLQGRLKPALIHFVLDLLLWLILLGWIMHIYSAYNAATWRRGD